MNTHINNSKEITLFKYDDLYKCSYGHIKESTYNSSYTLQLNMPSLKDNLSSVISPFGTVKTQFSNQVYSGFMIASNLFLTVLEENSQEELSSFKESHVLFSNDKQIQIKRGKRIENNLIVLILKEEIGDEIGYRGLSDYKYEYDNLPTLSISYRQEDNQLYLDDNTKTGFVFKLLNGRYYITQIGNSTITEDIIMKIDEVYRKNLQSYHLIGVCSSNQKTLKKVNKFNFNKLEFIQKKKKILKGLK